MDLKSISVLGRDPSTRNRLNAVSFQQNALLSYQGWQYCSYYLAKDDLDDSIRHVVIARRKLPTGQWEVLRLPDYDQTTDDGHNTISMGICPIDGTIHLAFDHHCNQLKYRVSVPNLCNDPESIEWNIDAFCPVQSTLPGVSSAHFQEVTYPRFVLGQDTLLFEFRIGMAGEGSDILCRYEPQSKLFTYIDTYLVGVGNNPYIHGLSFEARRSRLHVSWMYREYVPVDKSSFMHMQQSGPNGPENNRDLAYTYSDDFGRTWHATNGSVLTQTSIHPDCPEIIVQRMACGSGLLNQEGQCVDADGNFHVLSRDSLRTGKLEWQHIMRNAETGQWTTEALPYLEPTTVGRRGKVCSDSATGHIYFIVPGNKSDVLNILVKRRISGLTPTHFGGFELLCSLEGYDGEPLIDEQRLASSDGFLSIYTSSSSQPRKLVVLDFDISKHF